MFCFQCGNELINEGMFCISCGAHQRVQPNLKPAWHGEDQAEKPPAVSSVPKWALPLLFLVSLLTLMLILTDMGVIQISPKSAEAIQAGSSRTATNMKVTKTASIRISPFTDAQAIKRVRNGDVVISGGAEGKWTKVTWTGGTGWIESVNLAGDNATKELKRERERQAKQEEQDKQRTFQKLVASYHDSGLRNISDNTVVKIEWDEESWHLIPLKTKQGIFDTFKFITHKPVRIVGRASGDTLAKIGILADTIN